MKNENKNEVLATRAVINIDVYSILVNTFNDKEIYEVIYIDEEKMKAVLLEKGKFRNWTVIDLTNTSLKKIGE